jgi:hypothetical protein
VNRGSGRSAMEVPLLWIFFFRTALLISFAKALSMDDQFVLWEQDTYPSASFHKSLNAAQVFELDIQSTQHYMLDLCGTENSNPQEISFVVSTSGKMTSRSIIRKVTILISLLFIWKE